MTTNKPDASAIADALESLMRGYENLLEGGIDRITYLNGDCYLISDMLQSAEKALAAYRKQGGEV